MWFLCLDPSFFFCVLRPDEVILISALFIAWVYQLFKLTLFWSDPCKWFCDPVFSYWCLDQDNITEGTLVPFILGFLAAQLTLCPLTGCQARGQYPALQKVQQLQLHLWSVCALLYYRKEKKKTKAKFIKCLYVTRYSSEILNIVVCTFDNSKSKKNVSFRWGFTYLLRVSLEFMKKNPQNCQDWKRPSKSSSPTISPAPPKSPPDHVPRWLIQMSIKHFQRWWLHHFPGHLIPMPGHTSSDFFFFLILGLNFPCCNLRPFLLILSLEIWQKRPTPTSFQGVVENNVTKVNVLNFRFFSSYEIILFTVQFKLYLREKKCLPSCIFLDSVQT